MSEVFKELQRWVGGNSILVVTIKGILCRFNCPFNVEVISDEEGLEIGSKHSVTKVLVDGQLHLLYQVSGKLYPFRHFRIMNE